jgi:hypothetical protein
MKLLYSLKGELFSRNIWGCSQNFLDSADIEIYAHNNKHSLRSNTKGYGGKTHYTDSQNSDTTAPSGIEVYHLQLPLQVTSPETFKYTLILFTHKHFEIDSQTLQHDSIYTQ